MFDDSLQMPAVFVVFAHDGTPNAYVRFDFMEALALAAAYDGDMPPMNEQDITALHDQIYRKASNARDLLEIAYAQNHDD